MRKYINIFKIRNIFYLIFPFIFWMLPFKWVNDSFSICIFKNVFGIECVGCGITRAIHNVVHFNFTDAYEFNSFVFIVFPLLLYVWLKKINSLVKM